MYLLDFMNCHKDWEQILSEPPYSLEIKHYNEYVLLKYNQFLSDFTIPEVLEARGPIFRLQDNRWICVCRAMDKFANFSEPYAATNRIDWSKGVDVQEKVDGSLIKVWFDKGDWHISTNSTISAFEAECGDTNFGDLFLSIIPNVHEFFSSLHVCFTYWFELVSPTHNHIVVKYPEDRIYYLGCRNMETMDEVNAPKPVDAEWLWEPRFFTYHSLEECVEAAHKMGENEEGYVCVSPVKEDGSYLRIKVKGDVYLSLHHIRGNGPLTMRRVVEMWQADTLDDFIALCPEYQNYIDNFSIKLNKLTEKMNNSYELIKNISDRKVFAAEALKNKGLISGYLFARKDEKTNNVIDFLKNTVATKIVEEFEK